MSKRRKAKAPVVTAPAVLKAPPFVLPFPVKHLLVISLMAIITLAAYSNSFRVPFQFDDYPNIVQNASIFLKDFSLSWFKHLVQVNYKGSTRIFAYLTFALNYYLAGLNVFSYHVINFFIHLSSGLLLYWLLLLTFRLPSLRERYGPIAFPAALFSALLFLVHPIQTQSVTYIVQRMTSMAGLFYLLAMVFYVKGRLSSGRKRLLFWLGMGGSYLLGLFTKENVAILPLFVALYEFCFFRNLELTSKRRKALLYAFGSVALLGVLMALIWGKRYMNVIIEGYQTRDFTLLERVLTQFRVVLYYLTLLVYPDPSRLNLDYDFPTSHGLLDPPTTLLSILIVVGLIGFSLRSLRKRPLLSYFILWYFGNLLIESSIFPLEMVYEHRLYLPMIGPVVLFVVFALTAWEKLWTRVRKSSELGPQGSKHQAASLPFTGADSVRRSYPLWGLFLGLAVLLAWGSHVRNVVWKDKITLWEDAVKKSPLKPRVHNNLGYYLVEAKQFEKGLRSINQSLSLNPRYEGAYYNMGWAYVEMNQYDKAAPYFEEYLRLEPKDPKGYNEMGVVRLEKKKFDEAIRLFKRGLEINPDFYGLYFNLGDVYLQTNRIDEAMAEFKTALQLNPMFAEAHLKMAEIYTKRGLSALATEEINQASRINPSLSEVYALRGATYVQEGKIDEGIDDLNTALKKNPQDPMIYSNLGVAYRRKNQLEEAVRYYKKAIDIDPSFTDARINLGEVYSQRGMWDEAIAEFKSVLTFDPQRAEAYNNLGVIYLNRKNTEEAISHFKKALEISPKYGDACFNLAVAYYYKRDLSSAAVYAKRAMEIGHKVDPRFLKALNLSP